MYIMLNKISKTVTYTTLLLPQLSISWTGIPPVYTKNLFISGWYREPSSLVKVATTIGRNERAPASR